MTLRDWLSKHSIEVQFRPRGFNIENKYGRAQFVEVLPFDKRVTRHISDDDVRQWLRKNINTNDLFTQEERSDFYLLAR